MNFYVIKIQNFCDRAKPWLGKVEALFHAIHPLLLGYEKRLCRIFYTPSFFFFIRICFASMINIGLIRAHPINIGEICCSDEVQGRKAEEWLKGACME